MKNNLTFEKVMGYCYYEIHNDRIGFQTDYYALDYDGYEYIEILEYEELDELVET